METYQALWACSRHRAHRDRVNELRDHQLSMAIQPELVAPRRPRRAQTHGVLRPLLPWQERGVNIPEFRL